MRVCVTDSSVLSDFLGESIAIEVVVFDLELLSEFDGDLSGEGELLGGVVPRQDHARGDGQVERVDRGLEGDDAVVHVERELLQQLWVLEALGLRQQVQHLAHLRLVAHALEQLDQHHVLLRVRAEVLVDQEPHEALQDQSVVDRVKLHVRNQVPARLLATSLAAIHHVVSDKEQSLQLTNSTHTIHIRYARVSAKVRLRSPAQRIGAARGLCGLVV